MTRRIARLIGCCLALSFAGTAATAAPVPTAPAATPFRVGALQLWALSDELNVLLNDGKVFGKDVGAAAVAAVLRERGVATDTITLGVDALLVRMPDHLVLIDTGLGPKFGGVLMRSLAAAGFTPDAVTDVLITHSHGDHVSGLLTADGALAFPRAAVRMSAAEWRWLRGKPEQQALVTAIAPQVHSFAPGATVLPGITAIALPGHTPGHSGYRIVSGRVSLTDIGDTAHSSIVSLEHPGWTIGYDSDAAGGRSSRETELARLATSGETVFAPHFPYPGVGRIRKATTGYVFQPTLPH